MAPWLSLIELDVENPVKSMGSRAEEVAPPIQHLIDMYRSLGSIPILNKEDEWTM